MITLRQFCTLVHVALRAHANNPMPASPCPSFSLQVAEDYETCMEQLQAELAGVSKVSFTLDGWMLQAGVRNNSSCSLVFI